MTDGNGTTGGIEGEASRAGETAGEGALEGGPSIGERARALEEHAGKGRRGKGGRPPKPEGEAAKAILAVRVTPADEADLAALVAREHERLRVLGVPDSVIGKVTGADIVRSLIRAAARATGPGGLAAMAPAEISTSSTPAAAPVVTTAPARPPLAHPEPAPEAGPAVGAGDAQDSDDTLRARMATWCEAYDAAGKPHRGGQAALAALVGCDKSVITRWKGGGAPLPAADRAGLVKALRRSPEKVRAERERGGA